MKKIKMKDTILSHYQKVHELEMDGTPSECLNQTPHHAALAGIQDAGVD